MVCRISQQKFDMQELGRRSWRLLLSSSSLKRVDGVPKERVQSTEDEEEAKGYMSVSSKDLLWFGMENSMVKELLWL